MSQDLIADPELLPPVPLPVLARPMTGATRTALAGLALLAVAGVWRSGGALIPLAPAAAPTAVAASTPVLLAPVLIKPQIQASAGEPAALTPPADGAPEAAAPLAAGIAP
jgi:hypothetical protein